MDNKFNLTKALYEDSGSQVMCFDHDAKLIWYNHAASTLVDNNSIQSLYQLSITSDLTDEISRLNQNTVCHVIGNPYLEIGGITLIPFLNSDKNQLHFILAMIAPLLTPERESGYQNIISLIGAQYREPLFAIQNMLLPIKNKLERYECYDEYRLLKQISNQCYKTMRATTNLTNYMQYCNVDVPIHFETISMNQFVKDLCERIGRFVRRTDITFEYHICTETIVSKIDTDKLSVAVFNLIANSCLYTRPGNEITVSLTKNSNNFIITVVDKGEGIAPEIQSRVFESFYSYDRNGSPACGMGLGLPIVKRVTDMHNGTCVLTSELNVGTTVAMQFPIVDGEISGAVESVVSGPDSRFSPLFLYLSDVCDINTLEL